MSGPPAITNRPYAIVQQGQTIKDIAKAQLDEGAAPRAIEQLSFEIAQVNKLSADNNYSVSTGNLLFFSSTAREAYLNPKELKCKTEVR